MTILASLATPTDGMFDFGGLDFSGLQRAILLLDGIRGSADGTELHLHLTIGGAVLSAGYRWRHQSLSSSGSTDTLASAAGTSIPLCAGTSAPWAVGNAAAKAYAGRVALSHLDSGLYKLVEHDGTAIGSSGNCFRITGGGILERTGVVDGLTVAGAGGTLVAGRVTVYGVPYDPADEPEAAVPVSSWLGAIL
jgi:hypothetical protein